MRIFARFNHKFVEARRATEMHFRVLTELGGCIGGLSQILLGKLAQADLAVNRHKDVDHQRDQSLIRADIRGRLLAPNMLLASGEREHEAALAVFVSRLPGESAGHLADEFIFRGEDAAIRAAKANWNSERLRLHGDNVTGPRRFDDTQ